VKAAAAAAAAAAVPCVPPQDALRDLLPPAPASGGAATALALNAAAGAGAGAISLAVVYPFEFATVRMAADLGLGTERQFGRGGWDVCWDCACHAGELLPAPVMLCAVVSACKQFGQRSTHLFM
jgi:hypothetical protein